MSEKKDFFVSYNKADQQIAKWIAWTLEENNRYSTVIQEWDFRAGVSFPVEMKNASVTCEHTIAVFSQAYVDALFTQSERFDAFREGPAGANGKLIPVRVEDFYVQGMPGKFVYIDLVGIQEDNARKWLLDGVEHILEKSRRKMKIKPSFGIIPNKSVQAVQKPVFNPIPVTFACLWGGSTDELVGRQYFLEWLDNRLLKSKGYTCALASLHGMGGMGKTFLSQVFAEKNREKAIFFPVYLGQTSPFNAGAQLLQKQGIDISLIDTDTKLTDELQRFYQAGTGILILDDVRATDVQMLFPQTDRWSVLVTTRDKKLARRLCGDTNIRELDLLSSDDALLLLRKVLQDGFREVQCHDYEKLCAHLAYRPYSIRLAAGYLLNALDPSPSKLLARLKTGKPTAVDDDLDFNKIELLLEDCLDQLEQKSPLALKLVYALSVGADQGMPLERFVQWQQFAGGHDEISIESALIAGRDSGIVLVESETGDGQKRILRLHSDLLRLLRKEESQETVSSLITYLEDLLVKRTYQSTLDRSMYLQVFALFERYKENRAVIRILYSNFWIPLWRTGELKQAFDLGELFTSHAKADGKRDDLQICYGNRALILKAWGRLDEAMELHKKEESICLELEDKNGLQASYGNQALILQAVGRLDEAMELHKKEESICLELGNKDGLQASYGNQALILKAWGRLDEAMALHKKQESICLELGNRDSLQRTYGNQALILKAWGRLDEAMELHKKEESICLELGNRDSLQASYGNQALILQAWGRLEEAMALQKKEESICLELEDKDSLQASYGNQALILQDWGRLKEAMELLKKQEAISLELGNRDGLQASYGNQAFILWMWERLDEAMELHKKKEAICLELGNRDSLQRSYGNQALILKAWGRLEEAMELHKKEESICLELGNRDSLRRSYGNQALILKAWGRLEEAMGLHKKEEVICIEVGLKPFLKICYRNQVDLYEKMKMLEAANEVREKLAALERELE